MRIVSYVISILIIVLGLSFSLLNSEKVSLNYYFGNITIPLSLLLGFVLIAGFLLGIVVMGISWLKLKKENTSLLLRARDFHRNIN